MSTNVLSSARCRLPDDSHIGAVEAIYWLAFGEMPPPGAIDGLEAERDARGQKAQCARWHQQTAQACECPKGPDDPRLDKVMDAWGQLVNAHLEGTTRLIGRRKRLSADEDIPNKDFARGRIDLPTGGLCADASATFSEFEEGLTVYWQSVKVETAAIRKLAIATAGSKGGLKKLEQQIRDIEAAAKTLFYDPLSIPTGGKGKIKTICLRNTVLFSDASFDHAWKAALKAERIQMSEHEKFTPLALRR